MDDNVSPPAYAIAKAEQIAQRSPCAKSKRGVVVYQPVGPRGMFFGWGHNAQPYPFACTANDACRRTCGMTCCHAEERAIRHALTGFGRGVGRLGKLDLLHVKIGEEGTVVPSKGPSCATCSRTILDVGWIRRVWLYEARFDGSIAASVWRAYQPVDFHEITLDNLLGTAP